MLVQNLAITYKCYSSIGNSLDLKEMMYEVLRAFVSETYATYGQYSENIEGKSKKVVSFGKIKEFEINNYSEYNENINPIQEEDRTILIIRLEAGSIALITYKINPDCTFFNSMFGSLIKKLNASVNACINVQRIQDANKKLEEQKEELIRANKAKDDFLANMSHELKTPLNSINVVSSVMKRNKENNLNEKQIKSLEIINKCGNDLLYLVNDVLDISKLEAHEIKINYAEINIHKFITQVYDLIKPQAKQKNLNFVLDIDSTLTTIYSDENKINQIIKNLLSNSLKFTKEGTISLIVKDEDKNITISVNDEGIGIPQEKLAHIFDRFKQVDSSTSRQYGGTGLGLAISQELALLLKGTIHIQSTENVGSNFKLTIPKKNQNDIDINLTKIDEESEIERIEISEKKEEPINKYQEKESILIFNSDPMFFFNVTIKLGKKYNVFQVSNTKEFLNIYKKNSIVKTIIDFSSIKKEELEEIEIEEQKKIIAIYEDKSEDTYSQYDNNICLKINKSNINKEITNV